MALNRSLLCSETFNDSPQPLDKSQFHNLLQPPFPASSSHTFLLEIASNSMPQAQQIIYCFLNMARTLLESWFMVFLLSGLPRSPFSILLLLLMFSFDISFLPKTFPDLPSLSWEPHLLPFQCFLGPCLYLYNAFIYSSKKVLIFYVPSTIQRSWLGDKDNEINSRIFIKYLECARHMLGTEETLAAISEEFGSSHFEFK